MESNFKESVQERAILVGLNADYPGRNRHRADPGGTGRPFADSRGLLHREDPAKPPCAGFPQLYRRRKGPGGADAGGGHRQHHGDF